MQDLGLPEKAKPLAPEVLLRLLARWIKVATTFQGTSSIGKEPEKSMGAVKALCDFAKETHRLIIPDDSLELVIAELRKLAEQTGKLPSSYRQELVSLINCLSTRVTGKAQAQL